MRICLINNLYKPYARGGAEKVTLTIAQGLLNAGHEVFIITTKPYWKKPSAITDQPAGESRIYYLNSLFFNLNKFSKFTRLIWHCWNMFDFISYFKIKKILIKEKCEILITNNLMGVGYLTNLAAKKLKLKHLHIVHDIQLIHPSGLLYFGQEGLIDGYFSRNYAGLSSLIFGSPDIVIFPSRWLLNLYLDKIFFIKSKRIVLPNPVKLGGRPERQGENHIFRFLFLGQLEKHKGLSLLIEAYKKVREKFPSAELIIAGSGSELKQAKIEAKRENSIKVLGWQNEEQIKKLLHDCHCLAVPTLCYENCPSVILEAFGAGLPVLAADLGGISELIGENAGLLFRPGNAADLMEKMEWALAHPEDLKKLAEAGREKAARFNVENYIKEIEELLK